LKDFNIISKSVLLYRMSTGRPNGFNLKMDSR
jgi:hypothetical protein